MTSSTPSSAVLQRDLRNAYPRAASAAELDAKIGSLGAGSVVAFAAETVSGSTLGAMPPARDYWRRVRDCTMMRGLICYPNFGNADGAGGDHVLLAPPFTLTEEEIDFLTHTLCDALEEVLQETLPDMEKGVRTEPLERR